MGQIIWVFQNQRGKRGEIKLGKLQNWGAQNPFQFSFPDQNAFKFKHWEGFSNYLTLVKYTPHQVSSQETSQPKEKISLTEAQNH